MLNVFEKVECQASENMYKMGQKTPQNHHEFTRPKFKIGLFSDNMCAVSDERIVIFINDVPEM